MRKVGLLVMAFVLAFGALGIAYAAWAQPLYIDGTVNMGYIAAEYVEFYQPGDAYSSTTGQISDSGAVIENSEYTLADTLTINVDNAYPTFNQIVEFKIQNNGTVPFYLADLKPSDITVRDPWGNVVTNVIQITDSGTFWSPTVLEPGSGVFGPGSDAGQSAWYKLEISVPGVGVGSFVDPHQNMDYKISVNLNALQSVVP
jgi:hypothetical protein